jgi:hypothetical protein
MTAFFNSIRNYFKSEYHGRYFSLILLEIARHEPKTFALIIAQIAMTRRLPFWRELSDSVVSGELTVRCEFPFDGRRKKRRADLAVLRGKMPVLLMEVKEFDHLSPENPDQLTDYLGQVSERKGFVHVYRFLPSPSERSKIEKKAARGMPVAMLSYNQVYKAVIDAVEEKRALGALLCDYMEDIGVGIYRSVTKDDRKPLAFLMAQMLGFPHQTGMGRLQGEETVRRGPDLISQLLGNIEVVGEWARRPNEEMMRIHCFTRFIIDPWLHHKRLRKNIRNSGDKVGGLPNGFRQYVEGGTICFQANVAIRSRRMPKYDYFRLELGFGLELEKGGSTRFFGYTGFNGNGLDFHDTYERTNSFSQFPNENAAYEKFADCLRVSKGKLVKIASGEKKRLAKLIAIPQA